MFRPMLEIKAQSARPILKKMGRAKETMHGTKEGCHSNHGPQLALQFNVFDVFSGIPYIT